MRKYEMLIDGSNYNALFENDQEAVYFKWECESDGSTVEILDDYEVSVQDILEDGDFEYIYKIEMIAIMALPNHNDFKKVWEQEAELKRLGII